VPTVKILTEAEMVAKTRRGKAAERVRCAYVHLADLEEGQTLSMIPDEGETPDVWRTAFLDAAKIHEGRVHTRVEDDTLYVRWRPGEAPARWSGSGNVTIEQGPITPSLEQKDSADETLARTAVQLDEAIAEVTANTRNRDLETAGPTEQWPPNYFVYACKENVEPHLHGPDSKCLGETP